MPRTQFSFAARVRSFRFAWRGVAGVVGGQHNAWIHLCATVLVLVAGLWLGMSTVEWALLALAIVAVWVSEAFNTAVELLGDAVSTADHPLVGEAKDVAAGAVLLSAVGAVAVGALVFIPRMIRLLER